MGGGDLNLKKSWHVSLLSNQRRVWEEEKKAIEERKRIAQVMKERQEERQIQELQEMQEAAGGQKRLNRVEWLYSGPSDGQAGTNEEMEGYLLGKRRIDGLLKATTDEATTKSDSSEPFVALQNANMAKDTATKVREDPLFAIKKQQQAAHEAIMNDPVKRKALLRALDMEDQAKADDSREHRRRHHHHERHHDSRRRHRHRSRSPRPRKYSGRERSRSPRDRWSPATPPPDRHDRLNAMQQAASELDVDRQKRLDAMKRQEQVDAGREEAARMRSMKHGGKGAFIDGISRQAGALDIGERMRRGKAGISQEREL